MKNSLFKKSIGDTFYYFLGTSGIKLVSFLIIPFINSIFSVEDFGKYDLFLISVTFITFLIGLGLDSGFAIQIADNKNNSGLLADLFTKSLIISLLFSLLAFGIAILLNFYFVFFSNEEVVLLFLFVIFSHISSSVFNFLRWLGLSRKASFINFFSSTIGLLLAFFFVSYVEDKNIIYFFYGMVIGASIGASFSIYSVRKYIVFTTFKRNKVELINLLKVSIPFVPTYLANYFVVYSDRFIIILLIGDIKFIGLYALFYRIAQIINVAFSIVTKGFLPVMYNNYKTIEGRRFSRKVYHYLLMSLLPIYLISFLCKDFVISLLGSKNQKFYLEYDYLLPITISSVLAFSLMSVNGFGFTIMKKTLRITYITVGGILLNIILSLVFFNTMHFSAIIFSTLISSIMTTVLYTYYSEKLYKFNYNFKLISLTFILLIKSSVFLIILNN